MSTQINYTKIRTENDIRLAKEKLKYSIVLQEELLTTAAKDLGTHFFSSLRKSAFKIGSKMAATAVIRLLQRKRKKNASS